MIISLTKTCILILPSKFKNGSISHHQPRERKRHGLHSRGSLKPPPSVENVSDRFSTVTHSNETSGFDSDKLLDVHIQYAEAWRHVYTNYALLVDPRAAL